MRLHMLYAPTGLTHPKFRGSRWHEVHDDLRLQYRKDSIRRRKTKHDRHVAKSNHIKQCGAN